MRVRGGAVKRGALIVFEGLDGCGKSTQLSLAAEEMRTKGLEPVVTREPTDGPWGRKIRAMAASGEAVSPETELEWFFKDRREHVHNVVKPALESGQTVLSDRSYISTVAYQGARGLDPKKILADSEAEFERPDLVLLFEVSPRDGLARVEARGGLSEPVFENLEFQEKVAAVFADLQVSGLVRIDAARGIEAIAQDVSAAILSVSN
ncbi:MAG: dTMP kinase [Opitutales bacterium TMED158]|nr:MAG: dTMP kinase [Opitutales bacterium TMED158]